MWIPTMRIDVRRKLAAARRISRSAI